MKQPMIYSGAFDRFNRIYRRAAIIAAVSLCWLGILHGQPLSAQDWSYWLGGDHNGKVTGFKAPKVWPESLTQQWRHVIGLGDGTPALVGDRLYAFGRQGDEEVILALNARDGADHWRYAYPAVAVTGPAKQYQGPRSSPAVADGRVVTIGVGGVVTCLNADTGKLIWRKTDVTNNVPMFFTSTSPLIVDGLCIIHLGGKDTGVLLALEMNTGETRWKWEGEGPSYSSPVPFIAGGLKQVVLLTEKSLMGILLADGKPQWRVPTTLQPGYWNSSTPVADGSTIYYSGQGTGTRAVKIEALGETNAMRSIWHNEQLGTVYNTPILRDGLLYGISDRGHYFCLEAQTGQKVWASTNRVSNFGTLLDAEGVLVGLAEKSDLVFFKPSREGFSELAHYKVSETPIYSFPVLSGKRIFIRDRDSIILWTLAGKTPE